MSHNEDVYKILIDYIQEDNRWKEKMSKTVSSIEYQTKQTNGRLLKAERTIAKLDDLSNTAITASKVNWKWIAGGLAILQFVFIAGFNLILDWLKTKLP